MIKKLNEMTDEEAFEYLQSCAVRIIRGMELQGDVKEWIGLGILALCRGESLNDAFVVKRTKKPNSSMHSYRYAMVEKLRKAGKTREQAILDVAVTQSKSAEAIDESWDIQHKIQKDFEQKVKNAKK